MTEVLLFPLVGEFAENKDIARELRVKILAPALKQGKTIVIDFVGVGSATQSFIHALISELIREHGAEAIDMLSFKNCNETIKKIISIVVAYMQESE